MILKNSNLTKQQIKKYKIDRAKLFKNSKYSMHVHEDIAITIIILKKEQTVSKSTKDAFEGEDMQTQYTTIGYRIDLYFHKHKLAFEVDE